MTTATPTKEDVRKAASAVQAELAEDLSRLALVLILDRLELSYGGWLLPAEVRASSAVRKSYELHKLIERIEDLIQDRAKTTVTVDLLASANGNGS